MVEDKEYQLEHIKEPRVLLCHPPGHRGMVLVLSVSQPLAPSTQFPLSLTAGSLKADPEVPPVNFPQSSTGVPFVSRWGWTGAEAGLPWGLRGGLGHCTTP